MNNNGFHASTTGGKKLFAVVLIMALLLAAIPAVSVFAAPGQPPTPGGNGSNAVSASQFRELQQAQTWYSNFRSQPGQFSNNAKISQYLDQYAFALRMANAVLVGGANTNGQSNNANNQGNSSNGQNNSSSNQGTNSNGQGNNPGQGFGNSQQQMGAWLHMMRGLREKIAAEGGSGVNSFSNNSAGIPVTGGTTNNNGSNSSNNSGSNSNSNNGTGTTNNSGTGTTTNNGSTGTTSNSGTGTATTNNSGQNSSQSLSQIWGPQFRELQQAQTWYVNFRTQPGQFRNDSKVQQWLDQYAFALRQADAIIIGGINSNGPNNSFNQGLTNSQSDRTAAQQQLGQYLHMMRSLRVKIALGG